MFKYVAARHATKNKFTKVELASYILPHINSKEMLQHQDMVTRLNEVVKWIRKWNRIEIKDE